jgi:hypothetical protein
MDTFISISEAVNEYSKSESTIRSIVKKIGNKKGLIKREKLSNGSHKIYLSKNYLDQVLKEKKTSSNSHSKKATFDNTQTNTRDELILLLKQQLEEKDKQIESLLERQREQHVLYSQLQNKVLLIEEAPKKKRWWQRR